jgi:hypothetical protein
MEIVGGAEALSGGKKNVQIVDLGDITAVGSSN